MESSLLKPLLNFTVAPRDTVAYMDTHCQALELWRRSKGIPAFNKEQYLQAKQVMLINTGYKIRNCGLS